MLNYVTMFSASFAVVFLLGMQSKNVNQSRYAAAMATSIGISISQFVFAKYAAVGGYLELAVMAVAGALGIARSIWTHDNLMKRKKRHE